MNLPLMMQERICSVDFVLMRRVHRWSAPRWIRLWMMASTRGGDGWLWYAMLTWVLFFGQEARWLAIGAVVSSVSSGIGSFLWLKKATGRKRPCHIEPHCWSKMLPPDQFSFPSGHTITAFAASVPLWTFYPALTEGLVFCALSVAISRILLGMHFVSDVIAGGVIGSLIGWCAVIVWRL